MKNSDPPRSCPICHEYLVAVEASLNRTAGNVFFFGFGSSQLQIRIPNKKWRRFMMPSRNAQGLYCPNCGALTLAPTLPEHRAQLGID